MPEASLPKVPGAPAPVQSSPMKVGEQATVKMPKSKKMADATDKPSEFYKAEDAIKKPSIENLRAFLANSKQKKQSSHSNERLSMDHDKKISAKDAAIAVLKKAHEMLEANMLAKASSKHDPLASPVGVHGGVRSNDKGTGMSTAGFHQRSASGSIAPSVGNAGSKEQHKDWSKEEHKKVLGEIKAAPKPDLGKSEVNTTPPDAVETQRTPPDNYNGNPAPGADPKTLGDGYKGHIKLAKFVGRMEAKRQTRKATNAAPEAPKAPEAPDADNIAKAAEHEKGVHQPVFGAGQSDITVDKAKKVLKEIKAAPKPDLGKAETGHEKGVHLAVGKNGKSQLGGSQMGIDARMGGKTSGGEQGAKADSKQVLGEIKAMPKPKLPG